MTEGARTLDELLSDPTIQLVMARDGWQADDIRLLLEKARDRAAERDMIPPAHVIETYWAQRMGVLKAR
ncbi:MAG: hypothetical protein J0I98_21800 [Mesorhizobium sp.]|nr:hypothetical protein [Mesorhizobium sp.]MBN9245417.1 hypothetical protein [Mesorhizobium sp.]